MSSDETAGPMDGVPASMTDYRVVVVGTDGSSLADPTVARAAWLAHHDDADLVVVCAWTAQTRRQDAMSTRTSGDTKVGQVVGRATASSALAAAVAVAEAQGATIAAALLAEGEPAAALLQIAEDRSADLIVLGATSRPSLAERLLGTVAAEVLRRSPVDVLVVRPTLGSPEVTMPEPSP